MPLDGNCTGQLLEIKDIDPDILVVVTFIVPPNCPLHAGCDGTPSVVTRIVYASDDPVRVPVSAPFSRTTPFGKPTSTGPVTPVAACVSIQVMRAEMPCTATSVAQRPDTSVCVGESVVDVCSTPHAAEIVKATAIARLRRDTFFMFIKIDPLARFVPVLWWPLSFEEAGK